MDMKKEYSNLTEGESDNFAGLSRFDDDKDLLQYEGKIGSNSGPEFATRKEVAKENASLKNP